MPTRRAGPGRSVDLVSLANNGCRPLPQRREEPWEETRAFPGVMTARRERFLGTMRHAAKEEICFRAA